MDLSSKGQVMKEFECRFKSVELISAIFESPEVVVCIPGALSLIMIRDCVQRSTILAAISGNDANDMGIRTHDHPSEAHWYAPSPIVSDDAGCIVGPAIVIKA